MSKIYVQVQAVTHNSIAIITNNDNNTNKPIIIIFMITSIVLTGEQIQQDSYLIVIDCILYIMMQKHRRSIRVWMTVGHIMSIEILPQGRRRWSRCM
jgi:hypothetical protein